MRIIFLCGSLEPGRDGVGDYVRLLSKELKDNGHQPAAIAIRDTYIEQNYHPVWTTEDNICVLRLPAYWPAHRRFDCVQNSINEYQPDWVSLQFVPYAFHPKGLPISLGWYLSKILKGKKVHLMMHETWVGAGFDATPKRRLLSFIQKIIIKNIIIKVCPVIIHTHLPLYRDSLQRLGWTTLPLPLFSNIPVLSPKSVSLETDIFRIGIFSQIDIDDMFIDFLTNISTHIEWLDLRYKILLIGGHSDKMQAFKRYLESNSNLHAQVDYTGFLDPDQISAAIQTCHLGLTPIPQHGLGKSGTVAAFLSHGIPVAAPVAQHHSIKDNIGFFDKVMCSAIMTSADMSNFKNIRIAAQATKNIIDISKITNNFLRDLENTGINCELLN
jgi:hypothetical protein